MPPLPPWLSEYGPGALRATARGASSLPTGRKVCIRLLAIAVDVRDARGEPVDPHATKGLLIRARDPLAQRQAAVVLEHGSDARDVDELSAFRRPAAQALQRRQANGLDAGVGAAPQERDESIGILDVGLGVGVECGECERGFTRRSPSGVHAPKSSDERIELETPQWQSR